MERVLVASRVSAHHFFALSSVGRVFSDGLVVIAEIAYGSFALLSSSIHDLWAHRPGTTTHETRNTYFPEAAYETFPYCQHGAAQLEEIGKEYYQAREVTKRFSGIGLRDAYNRFHNPNDISADIQRLRDLHVEMDQAVAAAYGWTDLNLDHGFHETKQGVRFTISEPARREVLQRLLKLNHDRYAEEVKQGLHSKKKGRGVRGEGRVKKKGKANTKAGPLLFQDDEDDA